MKGLVKALISVIIFQAVLLALGTCGLLVLQSVRAGSIIIPPDAKQIMGIIGCFFVTLYLILGTAGWMIFVCLLVGDR